ncbi:hypothetical protein BEWA_011250 [Theileria equi strain WA]|uniref:Uncharacterized protein n=1 Tax=Theileria equi strain WA TaxID=1537102 RepID=L0B1G2_THEEQ|nr:hypothetical protein BEWA_011250 [Theileria equi strain WA]AFZ81707.1 hypothetical protein BEWA_011250 [Theileria equi strain WA]|eukprot:XP_004831373.1 hypothetical protein BEWA_011250 [Theileria equi strain WA]
MDVDNIPINPSKRLDSYELKIVEFHRVLTESWRHNPFYKNTVYSKIPSTNHECIASSKSHQRDDDIDHELDIIVRDTDSSAYPYELLRTDNIGLISVGTETTRNVKQRLHAKLKTMEIKEEKLRDDNQETGESLKRKDVGELDLNLFNDADGMQIGDYSYTFCEEEEDENEYESEYNI